MSFDPAHFHGIAQCGPLVQCGSADFALALHVNGDGGAYFSLALARGKREVIVFLGAEEWPKFLKAVELAKAYYERLKAGGKCDEITPCPPG